MPFLPAITWAPRPVFGLQERVSYKTLGGAPWFLILGHPSAYPGLSPRPPVLLVQLPSAQAKGQCEELPRGPGGSRGAGGRTGVGCSWRRPRPHCCLVQV